MKKQLKKWMAILCVAGLLVSASAARAAPEGQTVCGAVWNGRGIYVDGALAGFRLENGWEVRPVIYEGTVYIPLRTVGEWLGGDASWDGPARTVSLTRGEGSYTSAPAELSEAEKVANAELLARADQNGVELTLCADASVLLDGAAQTLRTEGGQALCPVLIWDNLFLPVRAVAAMCQKQILWSPGVINLFDQPTQAQIKEIQAYLDQASAHYQGIANETSGLVARAPLGTLSALDVTGRLLVLDAYLESLMQLGAADSPLFTWAVDAVRAEAGEIGVCVETHMERLNGGESPESVVSGLGQTIQPELDRLYGLLVSAQDYLDRAAAGAK